jgi:phosphoglycolate phosphatase-like HAD superfamily hydrolase
MTTTARPGDVVLFDVDGTLVDSTYHHAVAWHRAFTREGMQVPMWRVHRTVGMGGDKLVGVVLGDEVEDKHGDALRKAWTEEYGELIAEVQPLPGAIDLVRDLEEAGYVVALASSGEKPFADAAVADLGVGQLVAALTTTTDADSSKPDADILVATLDQVADARRAVLLGDTPYDVASAARIGLACVAVLTGGFSRAELEEAGAVTVVEDLTELRDFDWPAHLRAPRSAADEES